MVAEKTNAAQMKEQDWSSDDDAEKEAKKAKKNFLVCDICKSRSTETQQERGSLI